MKIQSMLCVIAGALPLVVITVLSQLVSNFTLFGNYISDLGVSAFAPVFNTSLVLTAILVVPFVLYTYRRYNYLIILFLVAAASLAGVGIFPLTSGLHKPIAALFFLLVFASILVAGTKMRRKWSRWSSIGLAILGFGGVAFFNPLTETVLVYAIGIWVISVGLFSKRLYEKS